MAPLPIEFHPEAEAELDEAVDRYEAERRGVGVRFAAAVAAALDRLASAPELGPPLAPDVRRLLVPGFPCCRLRGGACCSTSPSRTTSCRRWRGTRSRPCRG